MQRIASENARMRENWLFIESPSTDMSENPVPLPFGSGLDTSEHQIYVRDGKDTPEVFASLKDGEDRVKLYPPYSESIQITHSELGDIQLLLSAINSERERQIAQNIISRTHYLNPPSHGMFIGCRFANPEVQEAVRDRQRDNPLPPERYRSSCWSDPLGRIVACGIVDELTFGIPKGRDHFAGEKLGNPNWREELKEAERKRREGEPVSDDTLTRSTLVRKLRLAWGSRFAVDAPYQDCGIGTEIARHMKTIAAKHRLPPAERIEVITTMKKSEAQERIEGSSSDFLQRAGYMPIEKRYSQPAWEPSLNDGMYRPPEVINDHPVYRKVYYYDDDL